MQEEIEGKFVSILKEIRSNKSVKTVPNPRSDINDTQNPQPSGTIDSKSTGVHSSNNANLDSD